MLSEKIKIIMLKRKVNGVTLAEKAECSHQGFYKMLKKDNWNEQQLAKYAEILNCDVEIKITMKDTGETFVQEYNK